MEDKQHYIVEEGKRDSCTGCVGYIKTIRTEINDFREEEEIPEFISINKRVTVDVGWFESELKKKACFCYTIPSNKKEVTETEAILAIL